eukprot:Skav207834  [mRNA]  locus=scaffold2005:18950:19763:- [translate_table: standard]
MSSGAVDPKHGKRSFGAVAPPRPLVEELIMSYPPGHPARASLSNRSKPSSKASSSTDFVVDVTPAEVAPSEAKVQTLTRGNIQHFLANLPGKDNGGYGAFGAEEVGEEFGNGMRGTAVDSGTGDSDERRWHFSRWSSKKDACSRASGFSLEFVWFGCSGVPAVDDLDW